MTKTQLKDALRNIWKQKISYISVFVIALLAVNAFLGITYASTALKSGVSRYYNEHNFQDLNIYTPLLLTAEELDAIRGIEGVADVQASFIETGYVGNGSEKRYVTLQSMIPSVNRPDLITGRLPGERGECAVEQSLADALGYNVGDKLIIFEKVEVTGYFEFNGTECTIVGIINNPEHISDRVQVNPTILFTEDMFANKGPEGSYPYASITIEGEFGDRFSREYLDAVDEVRQRIDTLSETLVPVRKTEVIADLDYYDSMMGYEAPETMFGDARKLLDSGATDKWMIMDDTSNAGYLLCRENSGNLRSISFTFSSLFVVVAALVIYASVSKMINEQIRLVGVSKALGLFEREVLAKYMVYGVSGTLAGALTGIVTAYFVLQKLIVSAYGRYYVTGPVPSVFLIVPTVIVLAGAVILSSASVFFACRKLLKSSAVVLLSGSIPVIRKKSAAKSSGSLYSRLLLRNMRSDIRQVIVMIVSVAGCSILLMIGFTLKYAVGKTPVRQFEEIQHFDYVANYDTNFSEVVEKTKAALVGSDLAEVYAFKGSFEAAGKSNIAKIYVLESNELKRFFTLGSHDTGSEITMGDDGIYVTSKFAEFYGLSDGDQFTIYDSMRVPRSVTVADVFTNFVGELMFMTPAYYEQAFETTVSNNSMIVNTHGRDREELLPGLYDDNFGFETLEDAYSKSLFESLSGALNYVVLMLIIMAGILSYFIIMNLSDSYIIQKKTELTIMRINGFTVSECVRYAAMELACSNLLGVVSGIALGIFAGTGITIMMEQSGLMFDRSVDYRSILFSALITVVFAAVINTLALIKIKNLKPTDITQ